MIIHVIYIHVSRRTDSLDSLSTATADLYNGRRRTEKARQKNEAVTGLLCPGSCVCECEDVCSNVSVNAHSRRVPMLTPSAVLGAGRR